MHIQWINVNNLSAVITCMSCYVIQLPTCNSLSYPGPVFTECFIVELEVCYYGFKYLSLYLLEKRTILQGQNKMTLFLVVKIIKYD